MRVVELRDVAEVKLGRQRSPRHHAGDSMRPYLRAANVGWSGLRLDDVKEMNFTDAEMETFRLEPGDVLLNEASGSPGEVGKPALWNGEIEGCAFQNTLLRVRPSKRVDSHFLLHYFGWQATSGAFAKGSRGVGIYHLGRDALAKWPVPCINIEEQRRIAAILDHAEALRARRRQVVGHLEALSNSIFREMFGTIGGSRWETVVLGEVVGRIDNGRSPNCETRPAATDEWGVLKLGAVTYGDFRPTENKAYLGEINSMSVNEVRSGDVLMTRKNTRDLVGAVALVENVRPRLLLPDLIFRLHLDGCRINRRYFHALMMNPAKRAAVRGLSSGSAGSMPNISKARLVTLPIELPPLELQQTFARRIEQIARQRAARERAIAVDDELLASLQSRAFTGML